MRVFSNKPLIPEAGASGAPLIAVIGVISFMAALALGGFLLVTDAARQWTGELRGSMTVQIKGGSVPEIEQGRRQAVDFLQGTEGVSGVRPFSREESIILLEPWFGAGNLPSDLPVPAIVSMKATPEVRASLPVLRETLAALIPGAVIDDHGAWNDSLAASARIAQGLAFIVFALVSLSGFAVIVFATRAGLAANRETVAILHLVGASDQFIAGQVQKRFLVLGLRGAALGVSVALICLFFFRLNIDSEAVGGYFLPSVNSSGFILAMIVIIPALIAMIAAVSSRLTVMRALRTEF